MSCDLDYCERTRGADTLFAHYMRERNLIIDLMLTDPENLNLWSILSLDNVCQCKMGKGTRRSPYSCSQCTNLRRLMDFRLETVDRPFTIFYGSMVGKQLIINRTDQVEPYLVRDIMAENRAKIYIQQYKEALLCGTPNADYKCYKGDKFTIATLINFILQRIFSDKPHVRTTHTAFICNRNSYSVKDLSFDNLSELNNENIKSIIIQILVILKELSVYNFSFGVPNINYLSFKPEPVSYLYDGVKIVGPTTVQIDKLDNASITINGCHYFSNNPKINITMEQTTFVPKIITKKSGELCASPKIEANNNTNFYQLTSSNINIYEAICHIGFPLYVGSFDFYCLMISLMSNSQIANIVMNDRELKSWWSNMWQPDDFDKINKLISSAEEYKLTPIDIIRGSWLRCDILDYIWALIPDKYHI